MGTPNKYKTEFCAIAESVLAKGESRAAVCAELDIARSTLHEWEEHHPEFREAMSRGLQKSQRYWESLGTSGVVGEFEKFGSSAWIFTMKNRFRDDYAEDKKEADKSPAEAALTQILTGKVTITHND